MNKFVYQDELMEVLEQRGYPRINGEDYKLEFKNLMQYRIDKILLVCSLYDYFTIVEDGHLQEALFNEYVELNLYYAPHISRAYSGENALELLDQEHFDFIIVTLRLGEMELDEFLKKVKARFKDIPIVLLASQSKELQLTLKKINEALLDKIFIWTGDRRIFLAIIKLFEDIENSQRDCLEYGVTSIILVEDSPSFYSSYLPLIYYELMKLTQRLIEEGKNSAEKLLRQRARPKILHAETYEEAIDFYDKYKHTLLGVISDVKYKRNGKKDNYAGFRLVKEIKSQTPFLPVLLQSSDTDMQGIADRQNIAFLDKNSRTLLLQLRDFMNSYFGFGDFIFRTPDGKEIARAQNIRDLRNNLKHVPIEVVTYHSENNHFSHWLIVRTQFELAYKIQPIRLDDFDSAEELRQKLVNILTEHLITEQRGIISVFSRANTEEERLFQIIGEGSLGGKARGLGFIDSILKNYINPDYFPNVRISIPRTIVLGTDVFHHFMDMNNLYDIALENIPDAQILREFLKAELPPTVLGDLRELINKTTFPIAVRSSSLLEDAVYQPFAGIYATVMIPNSSNNLQVRFHNLVQAIKFVYASTYSRNAKNYIEATGNRIEEERMGVILQQMVGLKHEHYFYPTISGVAKSFNYYPFGKAQPKDGIVSLALGLGKQIVDGGTSLQYSPRYPGVYPQFASTKDFFNKSQLKFWALDLNSDIIRKMPTENQHLVNLNVNEAEKHGSLNYIASTYSPDNDMLFEGIMRKGPRVLNFAPILKSNVFPLNEILKLLTDLSVTAMNSPVEIEFAASLGEEDPLPAQFRFLQVRPMVKSEGKINLNLNSIASNDMILKSDNALGNGIYNLKYVLYVRQSNFDASKTRIIASEINEINEKLVRNGKNYLLIGPGRWGSSDPWLGIPVDFSYISAAQVIVETQMPHMIVDPSQGSHFFHNLTSFKMAYFTMKNYDHNRDIDWPWLKGQYCEHETKYIRLIKLEKDIEIIVDGHTGKGVVLKRGLDGKMQ